MAIRQEQIEKIISLARAYGITRLILFGSAIESPAEARDIDIACDGLAGWKLFELSARLEEELETPLDIIPLSPQNKFTQYIEKKGRVLI